MGINRDPRSGSWSMTRSRIASEIPWMAPAQRVRQGPGKRRTKPWTIPRVSAHRATADSVIASSGTEADPVAKTKTRTGQGSMMVRAAAARRSVPRRRVAHPGASPSSTKAWAPASTGSPVDRSGAMGPDSIRLMSQRLQGMP